MFRHIPLIPLPLNIKGMTAATFILIAPCSLLLGAALQILVARLCSARVKGVLAFLACVPAILAVIGLVPSVRSGQAVELNLFPWDAPLALVLHVDALSVLFAFMGSSIGAMVLLYSIGYMSHDKSATRFYCTMQIFIGGFIGLVFSANLFLFYLCWELVGLCSFSPGRFLVYQSRSGGGRAQGAADDPHCRLRSAGSHPGALSPDRQRPVDRSGHGAEPSPPGFPLMLVALVAKSVQVPLHTWIPEAMAAPTPVSSLLHAACYVTSGVYLAARMHSFGVWPVAWGHSDMDRHRDHGRGRDVRHGADRSEADAGFPTVSQIGYMMPGSALARRWRSPPGCCTA